MKRMIFPLLLILTFQSFGQNISQENLEKYWRFRYRLQEFMRVGSDRGESNLIVKRQPSTNCKYDPALNANRQSLSTGDNTLYMGFYIGLLAMEYKALLINSEDPTTTLNELYYALSAINRLDRRAEDYLSGGNQSPNLNGFFLRDDIPATFYQNFEYDDHFEPTRCVNSDYVDVLFDPESPNFDPTNSSHIDELNERNHESLDQWVSLLRIITLHQNFLIVQTGRLPQWGHKIPENQFWFVNKHDFRDNICDIAFRGSPVTLLLNTTYV